MMPRRVERLRNIPAPASYSLAGLSVIAATIIRALLDPVVGNHLFYLTYYIAVILIAWFGRRGPALLTILLGAVAANYFFVGDGMLAVGDASAVLNLVLYVLLSLLITSLSSAQHEQAHTLQMTLEMIPALVWTCRPDGWCDYISPQWVAYTGVPEREQLGAGWVQVLHPDDRDRVYAAWLAAVNEQADYDLEYRMRNAEGAYCWFKTRSRPLRDTSGRIVRWFGTCTEIEDVKQAQEKADHEYRRLQAVLEALPAGVFITDAAGRIVRTNRAALNVWGGQAPHLESPSEYRTYVAWWPDTGRRLESEDWALARVLKTGEASVSQVVDIQRFDGSAGTIFNTAAPIRNKEGQITGGVAITLDISAQRQIERALSESEERTSAIIESAMDAILSVNEDHRIVVFNHAAEQMFGLTAADAVGEPLSRFIPNRFLDTHEKHMERFRQTGETRLSMTSPGQLMARRANGEEFPIEATISKIEVQGEKLYTVILRDITEQVRLTQEREALESRFEATFEQAAVGLAHCSLVGRFLLVNQRFCEITGYPREELLGMTWQNLTYADDIANDQENVNNLLRGEPAYTSEKRYIRKDGSTIWVSVHTALARQPDGSPDYLIGAVEDITQRRQAEAAHAQLAAIVEHTEDAIIGKRLDGTIFSWNRGAEQLYGYPVEEALGRSIMFILPPDRAEEEEEILRRVRAGEAVIDLETMRRTAWGQDIHVSVTISPIRSLNGEVIGASAIGRDITQRVQSEQQIAQALYLEQKARQAAEEMSLLKDRFLAMISHELRTPLTSILGFATTLLSEDVTFGAEEQQQFIAIINAEAERLKTLVENLIDISRLQAQTLQIRRKPMTLKVLIDDAMPTLLALAPNHDVVLDIPAALPEVHADQRRITQVISNMVHNAAKYSPAATRITLSARCDTDSLLIRIQDEGSGIPKEARETAFEAFRQLSQDFNSSAGAGLGLAISKGLIEAHGGKVWVEEHEGPGTIIGFALPLAVPEG